MRRLLLSCTAGPPEEPRTWSGTPANLLRALRETGRFDIVPYASAPQGKRDLWARRADRALGLRHNFIYGPARRFAAAAGATHAARQAGCAASLHLGTYDLPLLRTAPPRYLYVDNSYDLWERQAMEARGLSPHRRRAFRALEARALHQVEHVFTVGQHVADNFVEAFGLPSGKVSAVGTGLGGLKRYDGPKDYTKGNLLIVAKVRPHEKGLPLLLKAFTLARESRPNLTLTVIGGGKNPDVAACEGAVGTGWITAEELQRLFDESTLFVMPATYEPWGLSYLEALACRTPIVGLARNAVPEISGDGRYGFMLGEPSEQGLADLILEALSDPQRLARMGEQGQQYCLARYRWDAVAQTMTDIMLGGPGA